MRGVLTSTLVVVSAVVALAPTASAQDMSRKAAARPVVDGLVALFAGIEATVMATAESTPEALYGYRATPEVRTFGQILAHIADAQKALCDGTHGHNVSLTDTLEKTATTRTAIIAALKDTFAGCRAAMATLSEADAAREVPFGTDPAAVSTILAFAISHTNEHYGNLVTYLRLNGIVPPSSRTSR